MLYMYALGARWGSLGRRGGGAVLCCAVLRGLVLLGDASEAFSLRVWGTPFMDVEVR
jgi:hypothetical protein